MSHFKRTMAFVLVFVLTFAITTPPIYADSANSKQFSVYTCLGDSVAGGCAQPKDGIEDKFQYEGDDFAGYLNDLTKTTSNLIYRAYTPETVPTAYHSLVANALGVEKLNQCARSAMRAVELRYMLTGYYNEPDENYYFGNMYYDLDKDGFEMSDLDSVKNLYKFKECIAESDLITIALGSNDVLSPTLEKLVVGADSSIAGVDEVKAYLAETGDIGAAFIKLIELYQTADKYINLVARLIDAFELNLESFKENFEAIIDKIYDLSPKATVVCVGAFNPFNNTSLTADSSLRLNVIIEPIVDALNEYMRTLGEKYGESYIFADVTDTPLYEQSLDDPNFYSYLTLKLHPTTAGHQYMAEQILAVLNAQPVQNTNYFSAFMNWFRSFVKWSDLLALIRSWLPV